MGEQIALSTNLYTRTSRAQRVFFQASTTVDTVGKIKGTIARLIEFGRTPHTLYYATSREVKHIDVVQDELTNDLGVNVRIYDVGYFQAQANYSDDVRAAYYSHLQPSLEFLRDALAPSYPSSPTLNDSREVAAFMSQEVERRIGTTRTLESVTDSLIMWALEGTDPDRKIFMSLEEIISKVQSASQQPSNFSMAL